MGHRESSRWLVAPVVPWCPAWFDGWNHKGHQDDSWAPVISVEYMFYSVKRGGGFFAGSLLRDRAAPPGLLDQQTLDNLRRR